MPPTCAPSQPPTAALFCPLCRSNPTADPAVPCKSCADELEQRMERYRQHNPRRNRAHTDKCPTCGLRSARIATRPCDECEHRAIRRARRRAADKKRSEVARQRAAAAKLQQAMELKLRREKEQKQEQEAALKRQQEEAAVLKVQQKKEAARKLQREKVRQMMLQQAKVRRQQEEEKAAQAASLATAKRRLVHATRIEVGIARYEKAEGLAPGICHYCREEPRRIGFFGCTRCASHLPI